MLEIVLVPTLRDNYSYLIHDTATKTTAVIDPGEADPILRVVAEKGWTLSKIILTHHHDDHIAGMQDICAAMPCCVIASCGDAYRIPDINAAVTEGDIVRVGDAAAKVISVPGHTSGHVAYWFEDHKAVFTGDTLFAMGCGRLFEGTAEDMWDSLSKLKALPDDTLVYCGHEYTQSNTQFACALDPDNARLQQRAAQINKLRAESIPTVPSKLGEEKATNPFLRADSPELAAILNMIGAPPHEVFAEIRKRKDAA